MHRFEQLHERALAVDRREFMAAIEIHDLAEQGHFLDPAGDEFTNFAHDLFNRATALRPAGPRHDAKGAMHVAPLHDGNERRGLPRRELLFANRLLKYLKLPFMREHCQAVATRAAKKIGHT